MPITLPARLRDTAVYLATIAFTQLSGFMLLPIITRYLGPDAYGDYTIALALVHLVGMMASSWMRNVAFRFYFDAQQSGSTRSFYMSVAVLQSSCLGVVFMGLVAAQLLLPAPIVPISVLLAGAAMVVSTDFLALTVALLRAEALSTRFALAEGSAAVVRLGGTTLGLMLGITTPSFLFLAAAAASVSGGAVALLALRHRLTGAARLDTHLMKSLLWRAPGALPFSVGEWMNRLADRLVLDAFASRAVVGIYAAGVGLGERIIGALITAVFMMSWPDVLRAWTDGGPDEARRAVRRYIQLFAWLTVGPTVAVLLYSPAVVQVLGPAYSGAADVMPLVALAAWVHGLGNCFNRHFELRKQYFRLSAVTLVGACLNLALNLLLVPMYLAVGAAAATLISQTLVMLFFIVTRDRALVAVPVRDLVVIVGTVVVSASLAHLVATTALARLIVFAVAYALVTAAVWLGGMRSGKGARS